MLLYIQTHILGFHSSYYCDQPKPSDYFVDSNEKHRLLSICFLFQRWEQLMLNTLGMRGSYNIAPRHKRCRKKQKICCGLE